MTFSLSYEDIDRFSEELDTFQDSIGVTRRNCLRTRLLMEDTLINLRSHYGEQQEVKAYFERRPIRGSRLRLEIEAARYNPLSVAIDDPEDWSRTLYSSSELRLRYNYFIDKNNLVLKLPQTPMSPIATISIALLAGVVLGLLGTVPLFSSFCDTMSQVILSPLLNVWIRMLVAISGPVVFFTATTTTLNTKHITDQGGSAITLVARYFVLMGIALLIAAPFCWLVFPLDIEQSDFSLQLAQNLLDALFSVVPSNLVDAFAEANTQQLLLCAFILGSVLVQMDRKAAELRIIVRQANEVGLSIARWISGLVPYFASIFLCLSFWDKGFGLLASLWKPLLLSIFISMVTLLIYLWAVAILRGMKPQILAEKLWGMAKDVLMTGSINYSLEELTSISEKQFGVASTFANAALPQGLNLYTPFSSVGLFVFLIFVAKEQGIQVDSIWILQVVVMCAVLFVATPPVMGANLLAYVAFFPILGISEATLMDGMIFDLVYGVFATAGNLVMLQMETIMQAGLGGFLEEAALRAPLKKKR